MELLYATTNQAKFDLMKEYVKPIEIRLVSLNDFDISLNIEESGRSPVENAKIKANAYYNALKKPLFACDSGLYFDGVPDEFQPGVHVRRVDGRSLEDRELTEYYSQLSARFGGLYARYQNAICLVLSKDEVHEYAGVDIASEKFFITDKPHAKRVDGFPLDCLSVDLRTGKYYYDQEGFLCSTASDGFQKFFKQTLNIK